MSLEILDSTLSIKRINVSSSSLDSEGVLEIDVDSSNAGMHLFLDNGITIKGIRVLSNNSPLFVDNDQEIIFLISSAGTSTLVHESLDVSEGTERFRISGGNNLSIGSNKMRAFWSTAKGFRRWEV